jgi:hypothetical protein
MEMLIKARDVQQSQQQRRRLDKHELPALRTTLFVSGHEDTQTCCVYEGKPRAVDLNVPVDGCHMVAQLRPSRDVELADQGHHRRSRSFHTPDQSHLPHPSPLSNPPQLLSNTSAYLKV